MATLSVPPPLALLVLLLCCFPPAPAFLHPKTQPRLWFMRPPSAPVAKLTTVITATRVLTEVHLSSCIASSPSGQLPSCPPTTNDDEPSSPPYRLEAIVADPSSAKVARHPPTPGGSGGVEKHPLDPREDGSPSRPAARTFTSLQSMFMQMLHPAPPAAATPPLLKTPSAVADGVVTRTVYVTRRTGEGGVPTTTSTVSFTLSGCIPSQMPFPLEPCNEDHLMLRGATIRPTATGVPAAPATAARPEALTEDEAMLNGPAEEFSLDGVVQGSEESGSGAHAE